MNLFNEVNSTNILCKSYFIDVIIAKLVYYTSSAVRRKANLEVTGEEKPTNSFVAKKSQFVSSQTKKSQFHLSQSKK